MYGLVGRRGGRRVRGLFRDTPVRYRLRHHHLVLPQIFYVIIFTGTEVTGGENGLTSAGPALAIPGVWSRALHHPTSTAPCLRSSTCSYLVLRRITLSPFRGWCRSYIQETSRGPAPSAIKAQPDKIVAALLSRLFAGLAGVLDAIQN